MGTDLNTHTGISGEIEDGKLSLIGINEHQINLSAITTQTNSRSTHCIIFIKPLSTLLELLYRCSETTKKLGG